LLISELNIYQYILLILINIYRVLADTDPYRRRHWFTVASPRELAAT